MKEKRLSGAETPFKDLNGDPIKVHDYVKDADGNRYYINSHFQAVPDGSDAPAKELERLLQDSPVKIMTIEEVLEVKPVEKRRRGGRRKAAPEKPTEEQEKAAAAAEVDEAVAKARAKAEAEAKAAAEASVKAALGDQEGKQKLTPVTETMILSCLPDDLLAKELRRRGYTLCAVRPALIEL